MFSPTNNGRQDVAAEDSGLPLSKLIQACRLEADFDRVPAVVLSGSGSRSSSMIMCSPLNHGEIGRVVLIARGQEHTRM